MMIDEAEEFLRKNDPAYKDKKRIRVEECPYLTRWQLLRRQALEIPVSNLSKKQRKRVHCVEESNEL